MSQEKEIEFGEVAREVLSILEEVLEDEEVNKYIPRRYQVILKLALRILRAIVDIMD